MVAHLGKMPSVLLLGTACSLSSARCITSRLVCMGRVKCNNSSHTYVAESSLGDLDKFMDMLRKQVMHVYKIL